MIIIVLLISLLCIFIVLTIYYYIQYRNEARYVTYCNKRFVDKMCEIMYLQGYSVRTIEKLRKAVED